MISVYGIDHRNSSIEEREKLCGGIRRSLSAAPPYFITCNRVESYGYGSCPPFDYKYGHHGEGEVYRHLLKLACGLESQLLGERQIMGQLDGYSRAVDVRIARLIARALVEARRIRGRFSIDAAHTVADAVHNNARRRGLLGEKTVVAGTGVVAAMIGERFHDDSPLVFVSGKHKERAGQLAARFKGEAKGRSEFSRVLEDAGVLICATASPHYVVTKDHPVEGCALYDLSVPRNIDPALGAIDLDGLDKEFEMLNRDMGSRAADALDFIETRRAP